MSQTVKSGYLFEQFNCDLNIPLALNIQANTERDVLMKSVFHVTGIKVKELDMLSNRPLRARYDVWYNVSPR